jgi:hypothetical protein
MIRTLVLIIIISCITELFSQPNDNIRYFPIKEGNIWVYTFYSTSGGTSKVKRTIGNTFVRIDSQSAVVYYRSTNNSCMWLNNERTDDSLSSHIFDTVRTECGSFTKYCVDTNFRQVLSVLRTTKHFSTGSSYGRIFAKDIGLYEAYGGSGQSFYSMILTGCVLDGIVYGDTSMILGIIQNGTEIPVDFALSQNYPNPFNPVTKIGFQIPLSRGVSEGQGVLTLLTIYDALGKQLQVLVNQQLQPGSYEADWDASSYPSGVYYYKLLVETSQRDVFTETKKMVLIK